MKKKTPPKAALTQQPRRSAESRNLLKEQEGKNDAGFILRERVYDRREDGSRGSERFIRYTAWEPVEPGSTYSVTNEIGPSRHWGRVDTKHSTEKRVPLESGEWLAQQSRLIQSDLSEQKRARDMILAACPETVDGYFGPEGIKLAHLRDGRVLTPVNEAPPMEWEDGRGG